MFISVAEAGDKSACDRFAEAENAGEGAFIGVEAQADEAEFDDRVEAASDVMLLLGTLQLPHALK